jgi:putative membrane protein
MRGAHRWLWAHVAAVVMAAFGLVVLIPYPQLWVHLPGANYSYRIAMDYAGPLHMVLGAAAMYAYGAATLGRRKSTIFLVAATGLSLCFELLGTGTGWPFGNYEYLEGLGFRIGGRVPFAIPLSWYYLAFSGYILAAHVVRRVAPAAGEVGTILLGTWLLTAWDLVLDPAMTHPDMPRKFWVWHQPGVYLGMPLANLMGWIGTGALMMGLSRWLWKEPLPLDAVPPRFPYIVYVSNLAFGAVLCASVGLWWPIGLAVVAGIAPATLAMVGDDDPTPDLVEGPAK